VRCLPGAAGAALVVADGIDEHVVAVFTARTSPVIARMASSWVAR
jgi:hypothetical protein